MDTLRRSLHARRVPIRQGADVILIVHIYRIEIAGDSLVAVLGPNLRRLRSTYEPEIMFCVLQIVLCGDRIVAGMSVARQLEVLLRHLPRGASYFDVRPIWLEKLIRRLRPATIAHRTVMRLSILKRFHLFPYAYKVNVLRVDNSRHARSGRRLTLSVADLAP
jgi:hypothetical protein